MSRLLHTARLRCFLLFSFLLVAACGGSSDEKPTIVIDESIAEANGESTNPANSVEPDSTTPEAAAALGVTTDESLSSEELIQTSDQTFCEGSVNNADSFAIPFLEKPSLLQAYVDPALGGRVTRITDSSTGEVNKPVYSTMQAWNADESLLLLYRTGTEDSGHKLHDGHTYEFVQNLEITPSDIEEIWWSRTDPYSLYYVSKRSADFGLFKRLNVRTNQASVIADFTAYCGSGLPTAGNDVQMHSNDDDLFGFRCQRDDGHYIMLSYRQSTDAVAVEALGLGTQWNEYRAPAAMPSGTSLWHQGFVLEQDLSTVRSAFDIASAVEHSSLGMTSSGEDAFYQVSFDGSPDGCDADLYNGVGHLIQHDVTNSKCRNLVSQQQGYPYPTSGTHLSATSYLRPGRVALSSIGSSDQLIYFTNGIPAPALLSEIYVVDTDPENPVVCRLAHHRSAGKSAKNGGYTAYFGEPHATLSPTGTRVVFGSDWYDSGSVDTYILELTEYSQPQ